jgi:uncharacterized RmlC-like cupin family protein
VGDGLAVVELAAGVPHLQERVSPHETSVLAARHDPRAAVTSFIATRNALQAIRAEASSHALDLASATNPSPS